MIYASIPIAKEIKLIRGTLGCSQEKLAHIVGVGTRTIARWEHNQSTPHILAMEKVRKIEKFIKKLLEIFEKKDALEWIHTPNKSLNEQHTPLHEIMYNQEGLDKVTELLNAVEWGIIT